MRIIAFVLNRPQVERILEHISVIGGRAWMPTEPERLPPVGRRATADAAPGGAAGAIAAALGFGFNRSLRPTPGRRWTRRRGRVRTAGIDPSDRRTVSR